MALNGDRLGLAIAAAIEAAAQSNPSDRNEWFKALGNAIVNEITGHAEVAVASVTLVTSGLESSGPGTGTVS